MTLGVASTMPPQAPLSPTISTGKCHLSFSLQSMPTTDNLLRTRSLAVVMACHNRKDKTLACLLALREAARRAQLSHAIYLFDDGSNDGTADAVLAMEPTATVLHGDGSYFWNRSMHAAFAAAMHQAHEAYLWLNDDTLLTAEALLDLYATLQWKPGKPTLVVGAVCDPSGKRLSYGGSRRVAPRWRPFLARQVHPDGKPAPVDIINGNVVLVPHTVAMSLGNLDPTFEHAMGDTDYALRARRAGIEILQTGRFVGECPRNATQGTLRDGKTPLHQRLKNAFSRKGLPPRSWWTLCRRHGGLLWPVHFAWGYTKVVLGRSW
jgi:GT2 family glycosyltransferase